MNIITIYLSTKSKDKTEEQGEQIEMEENCIVQNITENERIGTIKALSSPTTNHVHLLLGNNKQLA